MEESEYILGLFYSDENGVVFDNIKRSKDLTEERKNELIMLPFKFLGPVFMTESSTKEKKWIIEFIEASLSLYDVSTDNVAILQSFFNLNSSIDSGEGITNLYALIGSPYTEDIKVIYDKMVKYIHPSIIQGKIINEGFQGKNFNYNTFIKNELKRGLELIEYHLGSARKAYWEEQTNYQCIALIEREVIDNDKKSCLYTFKETSPLIEKNIPSYYIMATLPGYYENLIRQTLEVFGKKGIYPHLRKIKLRYEKKKVIYMEEFWMSSNEKKSFGVVLIPDDEKREKITNLSYFKKFLRLLLDSNKKLEEILPEINPNFSTFKWGINSEEDLNKIHKILDKID